MPRNALAAKLVASSRAREIARAFVPLAPRVPIDNALLRLGAKPELDAATDRLLTAFFAPDVRELSALLGRRVPCRRWPDVASRDQARITEEPVALRPR